MNTYSCKKCGLTIPVTCSKCDRVVDIKVTGEGCLTKKINVLTAQAYQLLKTFV